MDRRYFHLSISSESSLGSASVCQIVVCSSPPKMGNKSCDVYLHKAHIYQNEDASL